jgi:hypothetical protein
MSINENAMSHDLLTSYMSPPMTWTPKHPWLPHRSPWGGRHASTHKNTYRGFKFPGATPGRLFLKPQEKPVIRLDHGEYRREEGGEDTDE